MVSGSKCHACSCNIHVAFGLLHRSQRFYKHIESNLLKSCPIDPSSQTIKVMLRYTICITIEIILMT